MVKKQLKTRNIENNPVLEAMLEVPRHMFIPEKYQEYAYQDTAVPIEEGQTISQPYIVARMIQELRLEKNNKVLEIGTGSGYAAAVLSRICNKVYTIERHELLARQAESRFKELDYNNIEVKIDDGTTGWKEKSPFDRILVSAGAPSIPEKLVNQLIIGGIMLIPVGSDKRLQNLLRVKKVADEKVDIKELEAVRFVPLIGKEGWD